MKIKIRLLFLIALLIGVAGFSMFFLLFVKGEELLPKDHVFVPKNNIIQTYTEVTPNNFKELFEVKEVLKASITPSMITIDRMNEVMNKMLVTPLHVGDFLTIHHVADSVLVPREGEIAYPIPNSWWSVIDWTGRIGDVGEIWLTPSESLRKWHEQRNMEVQATVNVSPDDPNTASLNFSAPDKGDVSTGYAVVPDVPERPLSKPMYEEVRIRYVFDSSNRSIRDVTGVDDRTEGTGKPENVKMYLTQEQYAQIKSAVEEGYKLILAVYSGVEQ